MVVGVLRFRLAIFEAASLKDKRRVTRSVRDRIGQRHNVSIAEIDDLDHRQAATFGVAMVANDARFVEGALHKIVDEVRRVGSASLVDYDIEFV